VFGQAKPCVLIVFLRPRVLLICDQGFTSRRMRGSDRLTPAWHAVAFDPLQPFSATGVFEANIAIFASTDTIGSRLAGLYFLLGV
jgi:hypothetical protein